MKYRLLDLLACPACRASRLDLRTFTIEKDSSPKEVRSGILRCEACGRIYPIVDGIPRMLPDSVDEFAEMLEGFGVPRNACRENESSVSHFLEWNDATRRAFTFQSQHYSVPGFEENCRFFESATGLGAEQLSGRTVLDAGCGMGRFTDVAASLGAHVVGIELSRAVDRAYRETRFKSQIDLIQGDLLNPPLRSESFDAFYSIGVLNHTPNTRLAFQSISGLLRPGARASIWLEQKFQAASGDHAFKKLATRLAQWVGDGMRYFTTRMSHQALHYVCVTLAALGTLKRSDHECWKVRLCETFGWLAPKYQWKHTTHEVLSWFEDEGFQSVHPMHQTSGVAGRRTADQEFISNTPETARSQEVYAGR